MEAAAVWKAVKPPVLQNTGTDRWETSRTQGSAKEHQRYRVWAAGEHQGHSEEDAQGGGRKALCFVPAFCDTGGPGDHPEPLSAQLCPSCGAAAPPAPLCWWQWVTEGVWAGTRCCVGTVIPRHSTGQRVPGVRRNSHAVSPAGSDIGAVLPAF